MQFAWKTFLQNNVLIGSAQRAPRDPLGLCAGLWLTTGIWGQDQSLKLYFLLLSEQTVKMMNLKDKQGSGDVKQGTKKPFLPYRSFPLQYQRETNSLSFCENQTMSRSLLTEERSQRELVHLPSTHSLSILHARCQCFQKWFISQKLPKEINPKALP